MNKWVVVGVVALLVLGIFVGVYVLQGSEGEQGNQNQGTSEQKSPEIPGNILNGMFDALERGLNQNG